MIPGISALLLATLGAPPGSSPPLTNLSMWYKANAIVGLNDGDSVASWTDSSGNGDTLTQNTGANKPIYKTNILNGLPIVRFNGTSSFMIPSILGFPSGGPASTASWFVVGAITEVAGSETSYAPFVIAAGAMRLCSVLGTTNWGTFSADGDLSAGEVLANGTFNLLEYTQGPGGVSQAEHILFRNGIQKLDHIGAAGSGAQNAIGAETGASRFLKGDIAEILLYNAVLSSTDRSTLETYIHTKYAIF